jgi:hypothetical protein
MPEFSNSHPNEDTERIIEIAEIMHETDLDDPRAEGLLHTIDVEALEEHLRIAREIHGLQ